MSSGASNADIEYLVSMFEQQLGLLNDYASKEDLDEASRAYIRSFITHVQETKSTTTNKDITDFIDYGTKLMAYLDKNGISKIQIEHNSLDEIVNQMVRPELLKQPIMEAISHKIKNKGSKEDIDLLRDILVELEGKNINHGRIKDKLRQVTDL